MCFCSQIISVLEARGLYVKIEGLVTDTLVQYTQSTLGDKHKEEKRRKKKRKPFTLTKNFVVFQSGVSLPCISGVSENISTPLALFDLNVFRSLMKVIPCVQLSCTMSQHCCFPFPCHLLGCAHTALSCLSTLQCVSTSKLLSGTLAPFLSRSRFFKRLILDNFQNW